MAATIKTIAIAVISLFGSFCMASTGPDNSIDTILQELLSECEEVHRIYALRNLEIHTKLITVKENLYGATSMEEKIELLIEKSLLQDYLEQNKASEVSELSKIRYLKGLQIIKILYEKTLSLDHHFASVSTFREINNMSNPNSYPEFTTIKQNLKTRKDKKTGFDLTGILGNNIYTTIVHSFVSLFTNDVTTENEKDASIKEIECVVDFTLRMHNDLNTIYFETVFLQKSNESIMNDLQQLFMDYTKPIKYTTQLKECRDKDDWDTVRNKLNIYLEKLNTALADTGNNSKTHKMQINLHFPIDRLLQFITQYNAFIDQGGKFYEKFSIMLSSYENEQQCASKIPAEYKTLKEGIAIAVEKFNTAYKPVEINGSKMKEILYGINEYD